MKFEQKCEHKLSIESIIIISSHHTHVTDVVPLLQLHFASLVGRYDRLSTSSNRKIAVLIYGTVIGSISDGTSSQSISSQADTSRGRKKVAGAFHAKVKTLDFTFSHSVRGD